MDPLSFDSTFQKLTGNAPFPWQRALYEHFVRGEFRTPCNLPTGLGKTAVIPIWLIALAVAPTQVPRRLVYVVNRRTVVDQATREAEKVRERLTDSPALHSTLTNLCVTAGKFPLSISTLRGQLAESNEWRTDPTRPAIIVGTVDLIGSRLLFQGYRAGFKSRPHYAGFLGQDTLLVHDEAHLEPAFQQLVESIRDEQARGCEFRKFHVVELSATSRSGGEPFQLSQADQDNEVVRKRLQAAKRIELHPLDDDKKTADRLAELARAHEPSGLAILIFARGVEDVGKIQKKLPTERTRVLSGTMRGLERDALATKDPIFARFLPASDRKVTAEPADKTVYLVCTSAGEVGVNITADHLVCDLTPFDSMAQRFGRVNRFGDRSDTRIDIVHPTVFKDDEYNQRRQRTLNLLNQLLADGSPNSLGSLPLDARLEAFSPQPVVLSTSNILFDMWAMTTIREALPGRPPVEDWLHGLTGYEPPQTSVAWRDEVERLPEELYSKYPPRDLLEDYPLKPHELLSDRTDRVFRELEKLNAPPTTKVWLVSPGGDVKPIPLAELPKYKDSLNGWTVLLPPSAGGLNSQGFFVGDASFDTSLPYDVADARPGDSDVQLRVRVWDDEEVPGGLRWVRTLILRDDPEDEGEEPVSRIRWRWFVRPLHGDDDGSKGAEKPQHLESHLRQVGSLARAFAEKLGLEPELITVLDLAGRWHDLGKDRPVWQRYIENREYPTVKLAKSERRVSGKLEERYRHEFGSLLDLVEQTEFKNLNPHQQDLVLHLVAAHHGRARPHFPEEEAFDSTCSSESAMAKLAREVPRRFARLQRTYGRWGLAFLESLLRAADVQASAFPDEVGGQP